MAVFSETERTILLAVKGVGQTVIARFEQIGINCLSQLAKEDAAAVCVSASNLVGSTCWKNSPQARTAVSRAIEAARDAVRSE